MTKRLMTIMVIFTFTLCVNLALTFNANAQEKGNTVIKVCEGSGEQCKGTIITAPDEKGERTNAELESVKKKGTGAVIIRA